jgi:glycosyltransferase involved in cell wall biosynthesis
MKFLFLYTEIADYFLACCEELSKHGEVHVIRWPVNKEAPFQFQHQTNIKIYNRNDYNLVQLKDLAQSINPNVIICSGWIDKDYLKVSKLFFKKIPTVLTCDTHWRGDLKQKIATVLSKFTLLKTFTHAWVPGEQQFTYVNKLGFKPNAISKGFYSCNYTKFETIFQNNKLEKNKNFPHKFLYVGRYYDFKGLSELWQAFIKLQEEKPNEWELWCLGTGDLKPIEHPKIKHFGFVQPNNLDNYLKQTGVFILPSRYEPWGVVVHEFATAGFPLLISDAVGAKQQFLTEGKNGFSFTHSSVNSIKTTLNKIIQLTDSELCEMANVSNQNAKTITSTTWVNTLLSIVKNYK